MSFPPFPPTGRVEGIEASLVRGTGWDKSGSKLRKKGKEKGKQGLKLEMPYERGGERNCGGVPLWVVPLTRQLTKWEKWSLKTVLGKRSSVFPCSQLQYLPRKRNMRRSSLWWRSGTGIRKVFLAPLPSSSSFFVSQNAPWQVSQNFFWTDVLGEERGGGGHQTRAAWGGIPFFETPPPWVLLWPALGKHFRHKTLPALLLLLLLGIKFNNLLWS